MPMTRKEWQDMKEDHKKWLNGDKAGKRASVKPGQHHKATAKLRGVVDEALVPALPKTPILQRVRSAFARFFRRKG